MKLRWKKDKQETGLRRIGAGPVSSRYHNGEQYFATVSASGGNYNSQLEGWYWSCPTFEIEDSVIIPHKNTYPIIYGDIQDAKKEASEYIKLHLKKAGLI